MNNNVTDIHQSIELVTHQPKKSIYDLSNFDSDEEDDVNDNNLDDEYDMENMNEEEILNATIWYDLKQAVYDIRLTLPFFALLGLLLMYHLTIAPYHIHDVSLDINKITDLSTVRPVLSENKLLDIQRLTLRAETKIVMPPPYTGTISYRFMPSVDQFGINELPDMFYEGVMFGVSAENSHNVKYSDGPNYSSQELFTDLIDMKPIPTYILLRSAKCNSTEWTETGYGVYFAYKDLYKQGMLSSDKLLPWKRVQEHIVTIARKYKQVYVTVWYPHQFGTDDKLNQEDNIDDESNNNIKRKFDQYKTKTMKYKYINIIQTIIPTRTGLNSLQSTAVVWLSSINETSPAIPQKIFREIQYENENGTFSEFY